MKGSIRLLSGLLICACLSADNVWVDYVLLAVGLALMWSGVEAMIKDGK